MRVYKIDETLKCRCGHEWEIHHHSVVMNATYADYPLNIHGCMAEECEYAPAVNEYFKRKDDKLFCECRLFKPQAHNVQKLVNNWVKLHG